jgi:hypothetical protein
MSERQSGAITYDRKVNLEQIRWQLKAKEFPEEFAPMVLESVLDMLADINEGLLRGVKVRLSAGEGKAPPDSVTRG